jgi:lipopolysaccharide transport protein LptA
MKKYLLIFIALFSFGANMQILSKTFEYDQAKNVSKFEGDVNVTKDKDNILSDILYVYTTKNKKLYKLVAIKNVRFVVTDNNATYKGSSDKLTYIAPQKLFIFEGKVHIKKLQDNQQLFGDKVVIDKLHGTANVIGKENKPLKFIIKVND